MFVAESSCIRCRPRLLLANPLARSAGITALEGLDPMVFKSLWDLLPATALTWTSACPSSTSSKIIPCISREARRCRLSHTYDASFTVTDATTTPFRVPVSRNDGCGPLGSSTTAAISPSLA